MSRYYDDGICRYILTDEDCYAVDRCPRQQTEITVLGEINGIPVKTINSFAFNCKTLIKQITVSEGVESIGNFAFHMCSSLERVTLPETLKAIGNSAFAMCSELRTVVIPSGVESIGENAFDTNGEITNIYVVENSFAHGHITATYPALAEKLAFYSPVRDEYVDDTPIYELEYEVCPDGYARITGYKGARTTVRVPESINESAVTEIADGAFSGCNTVKRIILPDTLGECGHGVFSSCPALERIIKSGNNGPFVTVDGVLFDKHNGEIVRYPENKSGSSYTVPAEYTLIARYAFKGCKYLSGISIPMSVSLIGEGAFADCTALSSIELPASLCEIPKELFKGCRSLRSVSVPPRVKSIDASAFDGCAVEEVFVIPGTPSVEAVKAVPGIAGKMKMAPQSYIQSCMPYMEMQMPLGMGADVDWETVQGMIKDITMPDGTFDFSKLPGISEEMADSINNLMKNLTANGDGIIIPMFNGSGESEDADEDQSADVESDAESGADAESDADATSEVTDTPAETAEQPAAPSTEESSEETPPSAPRGPNPPLEQFEADFYSMFPGGGTAPSKKTSRKPRGRIPTESDIMGDAEFDSFLKRIDDVIERTEPARLTELENS